VWLLPIIAYGVWMLLLFLGQRRLLFPGQSFPVPALAEDSTREVWTLATSVGGVEAWFYAPSDSSTGQPGPAVIFAHGNGELIDDWGRALSALAARRVAVLLVEYPGYGRSPGAPSQRTIAETMSVAWDRLAAQPEVDSTRIVALGRSVGGGAAAALARERPLAALILQSTFTSVRSFAGRYLAPRFLIRDPFDNLAVLRSYDGPVLVIHGRRDEIIPFRHGETLAGAARDATLVPLECGHNDCPPDWAAYLDHIEAFLREEGVLATPRSEPPRD
jgi:hypothetical protein